MRVQVDLTDEAAELLRRWCEGTGASQRSTLSALACQAVAQVLGSPEAAAFLERCKTMQVDPPGLHRSASRDAKRCTPLHRSASPAVQNDAPQPRVPDGAATDALFSEPPPACPLCRRPRMRLRRQGSTGEPFWGCQAYPECRGTRRVGVPPAPPAVTVNVPPSEELERARAEREAARRRALEERAQPDPAHEQELEARARNLKRLSEVASRLGPGGLA